MWRHTLGYSFICSFISVRLFQVSDSLYNVPRTLFPMDSQLYDTPKGNPSISMTPDAAIDSGIYNVPRDLFMETFDDTRIAEDTKYLLGSNPLDIYDYPRVSISPDEEGIYDDPLDIMDMEIYDYPPDASELGFEEFTSESSRSSTITVSSDFDSRNSREYWPSSAVPPLPSGARPSSIIQHGSSFEDNQVCTHLDARVRQDNVQRRVCSTDRPKVICVCKLPISKLGIWCTQKARYS